MIGLYLRKPILDLSRLTNHIRRLYYCILKLINCLIKLNKRYLVSQTVNEQICKVVQYLLSLFVLVKLKGYNGGDVYIVCRLVQTWGHPSLRLQVGLHWTVCVFRWVTLIYEGLIPVYQRSKFAVTELHRPNSFQRILFYYQIPRKMFEHSRKMF